MALRSTPRSTRSRGRQRALGASACAGRRPPNAKATAKRRRRAPTHADGHPTRPQPQPQPQPQPRTPQSQSQSQSLALALRFQHRRRPTRGDDREGESPGGRRVKTSTAAEETRVRLTWICPLSLRRVSPPKRAAVRWHLQAVGERERSESVAHLLEGATVTTCTVSALLCRVCFRLETSPAFYIRCTVTICASTNAIAPKKRGEAD